MKFLKRSTKKAQDAKQREEQSARLDKLVDEANSSRLSLEIEAITTKEIAEDITQKIKDDLHDKSKQFEFAANIISDALVICKLSGEIMFMNEAAESLLLRSINPEQKIHIKDHIKLKQVDNINDDGIWLTLIDNNKINEVVRSDGTTVKCYLNIMKLEKSDKTNEYVILISLAEQEEEEGGHITKGTLLLKNGLIVAVNGEMERHLHYSKGELSGSDFMSIIPAEETAFIAKSLLNPDMDVTFDTKIVTKAAKILFCKMSMAFVTIDGEPSTVITIDNIGEDIMDRKIDVLRVFGQDYFFRSSTQISDEGDMVMYLTPDFKVKYANESMRQRMVCAQRDLRDLDLEQLMSDTEFQIAKLHFQSLTPVDYERNITIHLKNTNAEKHQVWTDRAYFDENGKLMEYRRVGSMRD